MVNGMSGHMPWKDIKRKRNTIVVNLFAGPGTGKSSIMGGLFSELKWRDINCEMAPEYAKEKVWERTTAVLEDQIYVFAKQLHTIERLIGQIEVVITDSPILLSLIYGKDESPEFRNLVIACHNKHNTLNIFLDRVKPYNPKGRLQDEAESKEIDNEIWDLLIELEVPFEKYKATPDNVKALADLVSQRHIGGVMPRTL